MVNVCAIQDTLVINVKSQLASESPQIKQLSVVVKGTAHLWMFARARQEHYFLIVVPTVVLDLYSMQPMFVLEKEIAPHQIHVRAHLASKEINVKTLHVTDSSPEIQASVVDMVIALLRIIVLVLIHGVVINVNFQNVTDTKRVIHRYVLEEDLV